MEMNVEKTEVMRILMHPSTVQSMIDKIGLDDVEYVTILGRMMTKDVQVKLNLGLPWQAAFNKRKKALFTSKFDLHLRNKQGL